MHLLAVATTTLLTFSFVSAIPSLFTRLPTASDDDTSKEYIPADKCPSLRLWGPYYATVSGSCTKYYRCSIITGQPVILECPGPLQFNPISGYCDIFQNVRCKDGEYPTDYIYDNKSKGSASDSSGHSNDWDKRQVGKNDGANADPSGQQVTDGDATGDAEGDTIGDAIDDAGGDATGDAKTDATDDTEGDADGDADIDDQTIIDNTENSTTQPDDIVNGAPVDNITSAGQVHEYVISEPTASANDIAINSSQQALFSKDFGSTYKKDSNDKNEEELASDNKISDKEEKKNIDNDVDSDYIEQREASNDSDEKEDFDNRAGND